MIAPDKFYLYELISKKITGVDVDKFDYFLRDSKATGLTVMQHSIHKSEIFETNFRSRSTTSGCWRTCELLTGSGLSAVIRRKKSSNYPVSNI